MSKKIKEEFPSNENLLLILDESEWDALKEGIDSYIEGYRGSDADNTFEIKIYQDENKKIKYKIYAESTMYDFFEGEV